MRKKFVSRFFKLGSMATLGVVFQLGGCIPGLGDADIISLLLDLITGGGGLMPLAG